MACSKDLHTTSFHPPNYPSICISKFSTRLNLNLPWRRVTSKAPIVCSATSHESPWTSADDHPTRRSDILRLIDQTDKILSRTGKFGRFGGIFVPEILVVSLNKLVAEFHLMLHDPKFQVHLQMFHLYACD